MMGKIISLNISKEKGVKKNPAKRVSLVENYGIEGDAHASSQWHRQVSMLAAESIMKMKEQGFDLDWGDFAENITTEGVELVSLPIGTRMLLGKDVEVEVTQIGKECRQGCAVSANIGSCIMPHEGIFVKVIRGGQLTIGDRVEVIEHNK
ncbi:MAG: hypothetical protein L3V56_03485 [Candidatus Magnetoovum sp. WYHC-5]|nr:hypothetical protein [Candidatus Magnetoovum sp. WYHC-5]